MINNIAFKRQAKMELRQKLQINEIYFYLFYGGKVCHFIITCYKLNVQLFMGTYTVY